MSHDENHLIVAHIYALEGEHWQMTAVVQMPIVLCRVQMQLHLICGLMKPYSHTISVLVSLLGGDQEGGNMVQ